MDTQSRPERAAQTILIVEEDEALRGILDHSLRHAGFAVGLASTVDEAFRRLDDGPDLVIAGASGLEICRRAKQLTDRLPPAVVLIAEPGVENKTRGLEAGADDFVVKPIYVQEVVARAKALLQRRERERLELSASAAGRARPPANASSATSRTCRWSIWCAPSPLTRSRGSRRSRRRRARAAKSSSGRGTSSTPRWVDCRGAMPSIACSVGRPVIWKSSGRASGARTSSRRARRSC